MADKRNMFYGASPQIFEHAKKLTENMTKHELLLWDQLKANQLLGLRFKAQHPISSFVADFYCHKLKLVIEIDGSSHLTTDSQEFDKEREEEMESFGIKTVRFSNQLIELSIAEVIEKIKSVCEDLALNLKQPFTPTLKGEAVLCEDQSPLKGVGGKNNNGHG